MEEISLTQVKKNNVAVFFNKSFRPVIAPLFGAQHEQLSNLQETRSETISKINWVSLSYK